MEPLTKDISEKLYNADENFLLSELNAKKEDITSRDDLKRYNFTCSFCHQTKSTMEATRFEYPLENQSQPPCDDMITFSVSKKMALVCRDCVNTLIVVGKEHGSLS